MVMPGDRALIEDSRDFFISYTSADRVWAEWIAWQLENVGYTTIIQAWDFGAGSHFAGEIHRASQRTVRTIALLSNTYLSSAYAQAEWQEAWREDPDGGQRKLLVIRLEECARPGLLAQIVYIDLFGVTEEVAINRLLTCVSNDRAKPQAPPPFPPRHAAGQQPTFPTVRLAAWSTPTRNLNFIGRAEILEQLNISFQQSGDALVQVLHGMGGTGKSQLAIEYAYRYAGHYDVVWWIPSEQPALIDFLVAEVAPHLGIPKSADTSEAVQAALSVIREKYRSLFIFDNADRPIHILPYIGKGHVLVTTRTRGWSTIGAQLEVGVFERSETIALLRRRIPGLSSELADELANEIGDLPLAAEQLSSYIDQTGLPASDYLRLFRRRREAFLSRGQAIDQSNVEITVATVWSLSLNRLRREVPSAILLLQFCAFLGPEAIPLEIFTNNASHLEPPLSDAAGDEVDFADTVGALVAYSLVRRQGAGIEIHRLLQAAIRSQMKPNEFEDHLATVVRTLRFSTPDNPDIAPDGWLHWRQLLPHILAALEYAREAGRESYEISWLLNVAGRHLRLHGNPVDARPLLERALSIREREFGPEHPGVASVLDGLGQTLASLGDLDGALAFHERALSIREAAYGRQHPEVAASLNNLGYVLAGQGDPTRARTMHERALHIREKVYPYDHPELAVGLNNLAQALTDLGDLAGARRLQERVLGIDEGVYGLDHPRVAATLNNLGYVLASQSNFEGARALLERALQIDESSYGPNHPYVAIVLNNLAYALASLGDLEGARAFLERTLQIDESSYGPNHPYLAIVLENLSYVLARLDDFVGAQGQLERSRAVRRTVSGYVPRKMLRLRTQ